MPVFLARTFRKQLWLAFGLAASIRKGHDGSQVHAYRFIVCAVRPLALAMGYKAPFLLHSRCVYVIFMVSWET